MKQVVSQDRQTIFDISIQHLGDRQAAFEIADLNDLSLTATLAAGSVLTLPEVNRRVAEYFKNHTLVPATEAGEYLPAQVVSNDGTAELMTNDLQANIIINE
jgi:hypothetical protein